MGVVNLNFDTLNDGDLNGQDGWVADALFDIQTTTKYAGAKGVTAGTTANVWRDAKRAIQSSPSGSVSVWTRYTTTNYWSSIFYIMKADGTTICDVRKQYDNTWKFNASTYANIKSGAINTWFKLTIEWNASGQVRACVDSTWTPWYSGLVSFSEISKIGLNSQAQCFFDEIEIVTPDTEIECPSFLLAMV